MELVKKVIKQIMTTGTTDACKGCFIIIPDLTVDYSFNVLLTSETPDLGFFDAYTNVNEIVTNTINGV